MTRRIRILLDTVGLRSTTPSHQQGATDKYMAQNTSNPFLDAPVGRTLIKTGLSMLPGTLALSGYNIIDTYFVGFLGTDALAAMGYCFPIIMLVNCIYHGFSTGIMTLLSHAIGKGDETESQLVSIVGLVLLSSIAILLSFLGVALLPVVLSALDSNPQIVTDVQRYLSIWFASNIVVALNFSTNKQLLTLGLPKTASFLMVAGMLINALIDPILIFGFGPIPAMGVAGASLATTLAQCITVGLALLNIHRKIPLFCRTGIKSNALRLSKDITFFAILAILGIIIMPISSLVMTWVAAHFGDRAVAAVAAASRLESVAFVVPMAMGTSLVPMMAQNYGAKKFARLHATRRFATNFAAIYLLCFALLIVLFSDSLGHMFTDDERVVLIIQRYFLIIAWALAPQEVHRFSTFVYTATNRPKITALLNLFRNFVLFIPLSLLALVFNQLDMLFWARTVSEFGAATLSFVLASRLTRGLRKQQSGA